MIKIKSDSPKSFILRGNCLILPGLGGVFLVGELEDYDYKLYFALDIMHEDLRAEYDAHMFPDSESEEESEEESN